MDNLPKVFNDGYPEPFIGLIYYIPEKKEWHKISQKQNNHYYYIDVIRNNKLSNEKRLIYHDMGNSINDDWGDTNIIIPGHYNCPDIPKAWQSKSAKKGEIIFYWNYILEKFVFSKNTFEIKSWQQIYNPQTTTQQTYSLKEIQKLNDGPNRTTCIQCGGKLEKIIGISNIYSVCRSCENG